jgi:DNA-binding SARP family transcriptional activator
MSHLSLSLLGTFRATLDDELITTFESDKVRALLAYLAVEAVRAHRREKLAGLLWPERSERVARQNLSQALANLRRAIGDRAATPPFLLITPQTLQFNKPSDHRLDVALFTELLSACQAHRHRQLEACDPCVERLQQAVALYRASFLEGFSIGDSAAFEEWALLNRERLHRLAIEALQRLAGCLEGRGTYEHALQYAWRGVELDPWREEAHQQLMRLLALSGQRGAALTQYETCRRLLAEELGVEPGEETTRLYEQIRDGTLRAVRPLGKEPERPRDATAVLPRFLTGDERVDVERPVFVARERELARLEGYLDEALAGQGRVAFVTGGAGRGKTALMEEFARRAQAAHPDLVVAGGNCNAYTGAGDPYLPFWEILGLLTGDVEARWAAGALTREHARRLWHTLPLAARALVEASPDLIDTFVPGTALLERATAYAEGTAEDGVWLARLEELVARRATVAGGMNPEQSVLFEQYRRQWADVGQPGGHRPLQPGAGDPGGAAGYSGARPARAGTADSVG